jgi:hypothetical protein
MSTSSAMAALQHAGDFTNSAEGTPKGTPSHFAPKPSGQHAAAPYKMAAPKSSDAEGIGEGLKWKAEQAKVANPQ